MCDKKCPPLAAAIIGFVLGAIVVKLVERFCPGRCCCGDGETCCCGDGEVEDCCCQGDADTSEDHEPEADPAT